MGAGASAVGGKKTKVKQAPVEADPVADALVPLGWLRVLRASYKSLPPSHTLKLLPLS